MADHTHDEHENDSELKKIFLFDEHGGSHEFYVVDRVNIQVDELDSDYIMLYPVEPTTEEASCYLIARVRDSDEGNGDYVIDFIDTEEELDAVQNVLTQVAQSMGSGNETGVYSIVPTDPSRPVGVARSYTSPDTVPFIDPESG